jgi:TRAP-type C4-dicarboxylate transport system permease small subunit
MEPFKTIRNVLIVALIAAAVYLVPGGGRAAQTFVAVVYVAFGVAIGYLGLRLYREHRVALHSLGDLHRGLLYGALSVGLVAFMARARMWETGLGELLWFVLIGGVVYALIAVVRRWRAY